MQQLERRPTVPIKKSQGLKEAEPHILPYGFHSQSLSCQTGKRPLVVAYLNRT